MATASLLTSGNSLIFGDNNGYHYSIDKKDSAASKHKLVFKYGTSNTVWVTKDVGTETSGTIKFTVGEYTTLARQMYNNGELKGLVTTETYNSSGTKIASSDKVFYYHNPAFYATIEYDETLYCDYQWFDYRIKAPISSSILLFSCGVSTTTSAHTIPLTTDVTYCNVTTNTSGAVAEQYYNLFSSSGDGNYSGYFTVSAKYNGWDIAFFGKMLDFDFTHCPPKFPNEIFSYKDTNTTTTTITGNDQYIIQNKSSVQVTLPATNLAVGRHGGTISSYKCKIGGVTVSQASTGAALTFAMGTQNFSANTQIEMIAIDNRGNEETIRHTMKIVPYSPPSISVSAKRTSPFSEDLQMTANGKVSMLNVNGTNKGGITSLTAYVSVNDGSYTSSSVTYNLTTGTGAFSSLKSQNLPLASIAKVYFVIKDKMSTSVTSTTVSVANGIPIFYLDSNLGSAGFMTIPTNASTLDIGMKVNLPNSQWWTSGSKSYGINMSNSDLVNCNAISFSDYCQGDGEGIFYPNTSMSGHPYFGSDITSYTQIYWKDNALYVNNKKHLTVLDHATYDTWKYLRTNNLAGVIIDFGTFDVNHDDNEGLILTSTNAGSLKMDINEILSVNADGSDYKDLNIGSSTLAVYTTQGVRIQYGTDVDIANTNFSGLTLEGGTWSGTTFTTSGNVLKLDANELICGNTNTDTYNEMYYKASKHRFQQGGILVETGGASITGNTSVTGTLTSSGKLTVSGGGAAITGATTVSSTLTAGGKLTVSSGGAAITGNTSIAGRLSGITNAGASWISAKTTPTNASIQIATQQTTGSYHPVLHVKTSGENHVTLGGIGDYFGFYGYLKDRTANGTDWCFRLDSTNGAVYSTGTMGIGGKLTVATGGASITGNSSVTGTLTSSGKLTVSGGGAAITGASTFSSTVSAGGKLTVSSGGLAVTGTSTFSDKLTVNANGLEVKGGITQSSGNFNMNSGDFIFKKADNGYGKIYKNHSASADYGVYIQDHDADGNAATLQIRYSTGFSMNRGLTVSDTIKTSKNLGFTTYGMSEYWLKSTAEAGATMNATNYTLVSWRDDALWVNNIKAMGLKTFTEGSLDYEFRGRSFVFQSNYDIGTEDAQYEGFVIRDNSGNHVRMDANELASIDSTGALQFYGINCLNFGITAKNGMRLQCGADVTSSGGSWQGFTIESGSYSTDADGKTVFTTGGTYLKLDSNEIMCSTTSGGYQNLYIETAACIIEPWYNDSSTGWTNSTNMKISYDSNSTFKGYWQSSAIYKRTTTGTANVIVNTSGTLMRTTSSAKAKLDIVPAFDSIEEYKQLLEIEPVKWFDKNACETNAQLMTAEFNEEEIDLGGGVGNLNRIYGCVAEQLEDIGLSCLVEYDDENPEEIKGVAYDRIPIMYIPMIKDLYNQIEELKAELNELKSVN